MIRLFKVYYPIRTLVLLIGEAMVVSFSFVLGTLLNLQMSSSPDAGWSGLGGPDFFLGILVLTAVVLFLSHGVDLYDTAQIGARLEQAFRIFFVLGLVALLLAAVVKFFPGFFPMENSALSGLVVLTVALFGWRSIYGWLVQWPFFRERVYVLGTGERAERLVRGLHEHKNQGIDVVGWTGNVDGELNRANVASHLVSLARQKGVHRVIVAMPDRRGTLPVEELLALRLVGVKIEEATSWLEKISGRIEVDQLYPSWLIFAEGFRFSGFFRLMRRFVNFLAALVGLILALPLLPFIALAIKLGSPGPVLYHQIRVGRGGSTFYCHKFRTMRKDAEADTGATWAADDDPRITGVGRVLRALRLDEIPQLWCVLTGDMNFVGPRPERPEFVEWLSKEIPYYGVRHTARPGITGWAQVQYKYGNTLEDAREKLQYDLFYIKNASIGLDLFIMFQTIKIVIRGRGR